MELVVRQATELGVSEVLPFTCSRCVARLGGTGAVRGSERLRRIAAETAEQSRCAGPPEVRDPVSLAALAAEFGRFDAVLLAWEEAADSAEGVSAALKGAAGEPIRSVLVVIGPEAGLAASEAEALRSAGATVVSLGGTVLRAETAAIVACALAIHALGGLGGDAC